ncbi:unnamed protein product [Lactuca saligna]|uniref:Uncharacterized protein n=1 Tax=Lactuca saligna TaxID=75948 RepID=A0AA36A2C1_LACSI|nr:unnamed protein product [Lactuca saligna]
MVGEIGSSQSGKLTIFNCLDGGSGTLACIVKESVKLYTYNIRPLHVEVARNKAIKASPDLPELFVADVICCTCVGSGDPRLANFRFCCWLNSDSGTKRVLGVVLVGDHCQLSQGGPDDCKFIPKPAPDGPLVMLMEERNMKPLDSNLATLSTRCSKDLELNLAKSFLSEMGECTTAYPYNRVLGALVLNNYERQDATLPSWNLMYIVD